MFLNASDNLCSIFLKHPDLLMLFLEEINFIWSYLQCACK